MKNIFYKLSTSVIVFLLSLFMEMAGAQTSNPLPYETFGKDNINLRVSLSSTSSSGVSYTVQISGFPKSPLIVEFYGNIASETIRLIQSQTFAVDTKEGIFSASFRPNEHFCWYVRVLKDNKIVGGQGSNEQYTKMALLK